MMPKSAWIFCGCLLLVSLPANSQNADNAAPNRVMPDQEQRARDLQLRYETQLPAGQFVWVPVADGRMPALWIEQRSANPQGGALIIHDDGQHPDWPRIVNDLRHHLPTHGWSTLAITLPPTPAPPVPMRQYGVDEPIAGSAAGSEPDPDFLPTTLARMRAGETELGRRGLLNTVIIGVGSGALSATQYLVNERQNQATGGLALILVDARPDDTAVLAPLLAEVRVPVLDVYVPGDRAETAARERRAAVNRSANATLTQVREQAWVTAHRQGPQPITRRAWGWLRNNRAGAVRQLERVDAP